MSSEIWKPRVTVAAIVEADERLLLVEESVHGRRVFNQPAGHLDPGESLVDAAVRECLEETAWTFEPEHLVGVYRWQMSGDGETYLRFVFCGRPGGHDPKRALDTEIIAAHWLTYPEILERRPILRSPLVLRGIEDYRRGQRYPLEMLHDLVD